MKFLVGIACAAVIAASGIAIGKPMYEAHQAARLKVKAMQSLIEYAQDENKVGMICRLANKNPELFRADDAIRVVNTCHAAGVSVLY